MQRLSYQFVRGFVFNGKPRLRVIRPFRVFNNHDVQALSSGGLADVAVYEKGGKMR